MLVIACGFAGDWFCVVVVLLVCGVSGDCFAGFWGGWVTLLVVSLVC